LLMPVIIPLRGISFLVIFLMVHIYYGSPLILS